MEGSDDDGSRDGLGPVKVEGQEVKQVANLKIAPERNSVF